MTKKVLIILSIILVAFVVIFFNLPFEITRKSDIEFGNELVDKIDEYQKKNDALPESNSWEILGKIGFKIETMGTKPSYEKIDNNSYQLIYIEGFDGPYLLYNSKNKKWSIDFPTIPEYLKEKLVFEENFPWSIHVTQVAIDAIKLSIENIKSPHIERDESFPSDPFGFPFNQTETDEFEIVGYYSVDDEEKKVYYISFKPKSEVESSGPNIIVEINIKTAKAIQVYMIADA